MNGIIIYSSKTGNTEKAARAIGEALQEVADITIASVKEGYDPKDYDFALLGGWVDRAMPDSAIRHLLKHTTQECLGLFVTLGAMPDSDHGKEVMNNLETLLDGKTSLGTYLLPGLVDPKLIKKMEGLPGKVVPPSIREKMIAAGKASREATDEERLAAGEYFKEKIRSLTSCR